MGSPARIGLLVAVPRAMLPHSCQYCNSSLNRRIRLLAGLQHHRAAGVQALDGQPPDSVREPAERRLHESCGVLLEKHEAPEQDLVFC